MNGELVMVEDVPAEFAARVIEAFRARPGPTFAIALSGGETARRCYERLSAQPQAIDWSSVDVYWGDERCVAPDDEDSNQRLVREALLDRVGPVRSVHPMRCEEPEEYDARVVALGRFDLVHLGLGPDGHTASLFAGSAALEDDAGTLVARNTDPTGRNRHERLTLTFSGISRARLVVVTVEGEAKRDALAAVRRDDPGCPATRVRAERVVWLADVAAASGPV